MQTIKQRRQLADGINALANTKPMAFDKTIEIGTALKMPIPVFKAFESLVTAASSHDNSHYEATIKYLRKTKELLQKGDLSLPLPSSINQLAVSRAKLLIIDYIKNRIYQSENDFQTNIYLSAQFALIDILNIFDIDHKNTPAVEYIDLALSQMDAVLYWQEGTCMWLGHPHDKDKKAGDK